VNGERINGVRVLRSGDVLGVGPLLYEFVICGAAAPPGSLPDAASLS
jgi:hypothetical protein